MFVTLWPYLNVDKMVAEGSSSPDPSNRPNENFLPVDVRAIVASNSDSEEEELSYTGYEALPQELFEGNSAEEDDSDSDSDSDSESEEESNDEGNEIGCRMREPPSFDQATKSELIELWSTSSTSRQTDIIMDSTKEEQIKNAMAGFQLPSTAIPPWAAEIPEEEWKEQLKNRVALLNNVTAV